MKTKAVLLIALKGCGSNCPNPKSWVGKKSGCCTK